MKSTDNRTRRVHHVRRAVLAAMTALVVLAAGTNVALAQKAAGRDPAETIRSKTVVGQSGVPAPPPPLSSLGEEVEKEAKTEGPRATGGLSPGLSKARRKADQKRRERDIKEGKKRPQSSPKDDADDEGEKERKDDKGK